MPYTDFWTEIDAEDVDLSGPFPAGSYTGLLGEPPFGMEQTWEADEDRDMPEKKQLTVQFSDCEPMEGSPPCGPKSHNLRITTHIAGVACWDWEKLGALPENYQRQLGMGMTFLTRLATALGVREKGDDWYDAEGFYDMLRSGTFSGQRLQFRVYHTPRQKGDGVWENTAPQSIKAA